MNMPTMSKDVMIEVINPYIDFILVAFEAISQKFGKDL